MGVFVLVYFCIFSCFILIRQVDFKSLVAYSSVLHISFCFMVLILINFMGILSRVFIGFAHGFVSPLIFLFVYLIYNFIGSRIVLSNVSLSNIFKTILILLYIFNLRFPIVRGFFSELLGFTSIFILGNKIFILTGNFTFIFCISYILISLVLVYFCFI